MTSNSSIPTLYDWWDDLAGASAAPPSEVQLMYYAEKIRLKTTSNRYLLLTAGQVLYILRLDLIELLPQNILYHFLNQRAKEAFDLGSIDLHSRFNVLIRPQSD